MAIDTAAIQLMDNENDSSVYPITKQSSVFDASIAQDMTAYITEYNISLHQKNRSNNIRNDTSVFTLGEAVRQVPTEYHHGGLKLTFYSSNSNDSSFFDHVETYTLDSSVWSRVTNDWVKNINDNVYESVYDISKNHGGTWYNDLGSALNAGNGGVPSSMMKGGMSVKFIKSPEGSYVQYRYMGTETTGSPNPFNIPSNWQGVDAAPTVDSHNLIESGGVYDAFVNALPNSYQIAIVMSVSSSTKGAYCKLPVTIPNGSYVRIEVENITVSTSNTDSCRVYLKTNPGDATYLTLGYGREGNVCQAKVNRNIGYAKIDGDDSITSISYTLKIYYSSVPFDTVAQINDQRLSWYSLNNVDFYQLNESCYYNLPDSSTSHPLLVGHDDWNCCKIPVKRGDVIRVGSIGGTNARMWALSDKNESIKSRAFENTNTVSFPQTLLCEEDGYLYVNAYVKDNEGVTEDTFSLNIYTPAVYTNMLDYQIIPRMYNPKPDFRKQTLHVLDIGNSYSIDSTHYLPNIINTLFHNASLPDISVYRAERSSGSFKIWTDIYKGESTGSYVIKRILGANQTDVTEATEGTTDYTLFRTLLAHEWDIIIIHQVSDYSTNYEAWNGNGNGGELKRFLQILRNTNPQSCIGYLFTHSYRSTYISNTEKDSYARWQHMADAVKKLSIDYGIDLIIPAGTAVQNMRQTTYSDSNEFSSDGTHLADGIGDYVASCAYYQAIFAPRYGVSVMGNAFRKDDIDSGPGVVQIDDSTAPIAQRAAVLACMDMYHVIDPTNSSVIIPVTQEHPHVYS